MAIVGISFSPRDPLRVAMTKIWGRAVGSTRGHRASSDCVGKACVNFIDNQLDLLYRAGMKIFASLLTNLQAVIAAKAARDRSLTVMLVALWARIGRMGTRLERLVALWRAGKLPKQRVAGAERVAAPRATVSFKFPTAPGWLRQKLGYEVGAYGSQLRHLLTEAECAAFLAAVPQAGRILRPLLRMLSADPVPEELRKVKHIVLAPVADAVRQGFAGEPVCQFLEA